MEVLFFHYVENFVGSTGSKRGKPFQKSGEAAFLTQLSLRRFCIMPSRGVPRA